MPVATERASAEALISVEGLTKTFGRGKKAVRALDSVTLEVGRGSVFGLLGPNGAGKTTFIKALMGLVQRWKGQARVLGHPAGSRAARERIGFLPEAHRLPGYLTGRSFLRLCGQLSGHSRAWTDERIPRWLERVGMTAAADRKIRTYSKGMQQRIGLAQALIHEPDLVFLDEPTDGVDPAGRAAVREIVRRLRDEGVTVFLNSHLLMEVERMCDRVVIMSRGRVLREGTVQELTPATGRVTFEIEPVPDDLEALVGELGRDLVAGAHGFELSLDQASQDAVVDRLRARSVSIHGITPRRLSLEEAFLDLVEERPR
jgi:ABC-2 type transport system ATP-binding protein